MSFSELNQEYQKLNLLKMKINNLRSLGQNPNGSYDKQGLKVKVVKWKFAQVTQLIHNQTIKNEN